MDHSILKKRLATFKTSKGTFKNVSDDVLIELLRAWEAWPGVAKEFYAAVGASANQFSKLLGNAKQAHREGRGSDAGFKEIALDTLGIGTEGIGMVQGSGIELSWEQGKVIRFAQVEQLIDFLKKVA